MDIKQLRYFQAIVEEGSFSRAAIYLGVAQPALSLHVRKMEESLGTQLLLRGSTGVVPTEAGELLVKRGRTILQDIEQTKEEIWSIGHVPRGTVRLGLPGTISTILSVPLIAKCHEKYPDIKIVIAEAMSGFVQEWLIDGRVDFAVLYTKMPNVDIQSDMMLEEELVLIAPNSDHLNKKVGLSKLCDAPTILPSETHGLRILIEHALASEGLDVKPAIELDSYINIMRLVANGYGRSVLPLHAVTLEATAGHFQVRSFVQPSLSRFAYLTRVSTKPMTSAGHAVHALLKEVVAGLIDDNLWAGTIAKDGLYE